MLNKDIDVKYKGKAFYEKVLQTLAETKNILGDVTAKIVSTADTIYNPYVTADEPKNSTKNCEVPVTSWNMTDDQFQLKRWVSGVIEDCKVDLETVDYNIDDAKRAAFIRSFNRKLNKNNVKDILTYATDKSTTPVDLSTTEKIIEFVMTVQAENSTYLAAKENIDNGTFKRAPKHGTPFIAVSTPIFVKIASALNATAVTSGATTDIGRLKTVLGGVLLIDLREAAIDASGNPKSDLIIWGTAGAATAIYRKDSGFGVKIFNGQTTDFETALADDLEVAMGDRVLKSRDYFGGAIKTETYVFANNKSQINWGVATT